MNHEENGHDSGWLSSVFQRLEGPLVAYAARLTGDVDRGRDVVQDAFLRLCRENSDSVKQRHVAWLYTVCRNRALDIGKKERRMKTLSTTQVDAAVDPLADPATAAERADHAYQASKLLGQLPNNQQEVIRLKIEHGLKYREISEVTGLSVSNVGYLLHQGLQTLRRQLAGQVTE